MDNNSNKSQDDLQNTVNTIVSIDDNPSTDNNKKSTISSSSPIPISTENIDVSPPPQIIQDDHSDAPSFPTVTDKPITAGVDISDTKPHEEIPQVTTKPIQTFKGGSSFSRKKILIPTILGILLLVGGLAAGVVLIRQDQEIREKAEVTETPEPTATPQTTTTPIPAIECQATRIYQVTGSAIEASNWKLLSSSELKDLKAGDKIYITARVRSILGGSYGGFTKAKFTVNSEAEQEVTTTNIKPPAPEDPDNVYEFYYLYTIPASTSTFTINVSVYNQTMDKWL